MFPTVGETINFGISLIGNAARGVAGGLRQGVREANVGDALRELGGQMEQLATATANGEPFESQDA